MGGKQQFYSTVPFSLFLSLSFTLSPLSFTLSPLSFFHSFSICLSTVSSLSIYSTVYAPHIYWLETCVLFIYSLLLQFLFFFRLSLLLLIAHSVFLVLITHTSFLCLSLLLPISYFVLLVLKVTVSRDF